MLILWGVIPLISLFIISRHSLVYARYAIIASMPFYILVARGIKNIAYKNIKIAIIGLVIIFSSASLRNYYFAVNKEEWREAAKYISTNSDPGELLVFNAGYCQSPFDYYFKRTDVLKLQLSKGGADVGERYLKNLKEKVKGHRGFWFILSHGGAITMPIEKAFSGTFDLLEVRRYLGITVYHFHSHDNG